MFKPETKQILLNNNIATLSSEGSEYNLFLGRFLEFNQVSVQIDWSGLNATDAVLQMQQNNKEGMKYNNLQSLIYTMDAATDSVTFDIFEFCGSGLNLNIKWNTVNSGNLSVFVVMKKK